MSVMTSIRVALAMTLLAVPLLLAQTPGIGKVVRHGARLEVVRADESDDLLAGDWIETGDTIHAYDGKAELQLWNGLTLRLGKKTRLSIKQDESTSDQAVIHMEKGVLRVVGERLPDEEHITVETEKFNMRSRDPNLFLWVQRNKSQIATHGDAATISVAHGNTFELPAGHMATITIYEHGEKIEPIPAWFAKAAEELVKMKPR